MYSLKIGGVMVVIIACYMLGELFYEQLRKRLINLKELHKVGRVFKANIRYTGEDIEEIMKNIYDRVGGEIKEFIGEIITRIGIRESNDVNDLWKISVREKLESMFLSEDELLIINRFGDTLGIMDKEMQIENTELYLDELQIKIDDLEKDLKQKKKLYKTLSIATGIFIVLLIV
ncbi:MAG: hypothetical protein E7262_11200 [Lachnospiraceae bacterium]|nr:hypothetical protein [Lachnospiraceae bacterium]